VRGIISTVPAAFFFVVGVGSWRSESLAVQEAGRVYYLQGLLGREAENKNRPR